MFHVKQSLSAEALSQIFPITPTQQHRLTILLETLTRWQPVVNLVGRSSLQDPWRRHVLDCGQLASFLPEAPCDVLDLGSGAGFPGLVIAVLAPRARVILVESHGRKAAFLTAAAQAMGVQVDIRCERAESLQDIRVDVVTARAFAPLPVLLTYASKFLDPRGICLFLKGREVGNELTSAQRFWNMRFQTTPSLSSTDGVVLRIEELTSRDEPRTHAEVR